MFSFHYTPSPVAITLLSGIGHLSPGGFSSPEAEADGAVLRTQVGLECVFLPVLLPHKSGQKSLRTYFVSLGKVSVIWIKRRKWVLIAWSFKMGQSGVT